MRTRLVAVSLLAASSVVACGSRSDLTASAAARSDDAGVALDATAQHDAASKIDATAVDADAMAGADAEWDAQCRWPANLDPPADGGRVGWSVGLYSLECKVGPSDGGPFESCVTDDPATCPVGPAGMLYDCVDECDPDEYGLAVGGPPGTPPGPTLPAGCRSLGNTPAGSTFLCCPCEGAHARVDAGAATERTGSSIR